MDSDGKYSTVSTGRTLGKSINAIVEHLHSKYAQTPVWVTVLHGRFAEKADALGSELKGRLNIAKFEVQRISPVLGVHTGPGIVGAAVVPMELIEDLVRSGPVQISDKKTTHPKILGGVVMAFSRAKTIHSAAGMCAL